MSFVPKNLTALEGVTFTLPLCVINTSLDEKVQAFINWGDGSKEKITNFDKISNYTYTKLVEKKYTFPGTYNISIEVIKSIENIFNHGFNNVGYYNMTVYPTTLSYAPSSNILVTNLNPSDIGIDIYIDDSGVPHDFTDKTLTSFIINSQNSTPIGSFLLSYSNLIPGDIRVELAQNVINSMVLNVEYYYYINEVDDNTQENNMLLQGLIKKIDPSANGITVS